MLQTGVSDCPPEAVNASFLLGTELAQVLLADEIRWAVETGDRGQRLVETKRRTVEL